MRRQTLSGDDFVREYGGDVCVMPDPSATVVVELWTRNEPSVDAARRMVAHLKQGITLVLFLSERHRNVTVFRDDTAPKQFGADERLTVPDVLPGFSVSVAVLLA